MEIRLLGTAAAEGIPALFCQCEHCERARKLGGKNIRTRTSAIIDRELKIDFPPDTFMHILIEGMEISTFQHLIITHTHHDHFFPEDIKMRSEIYAHGIEYPLSISGNESVVSTCKKVLNHTLQAFTIQEFKPFQTYKVGKAQVTPLKADHKPDENSYIYFIEKNGKSCLYGHDTGWFPNETFDWLSDKTMDVMILDCTNGLIDSRKNHMNIAAVKQLKETFEKNRNIHQDTRIIATHFSHNIGLTHKDLEALLHPHGIDVAYDGMKIDI
ncbi:MBL fold metallo-hydrolase [Aquibacillus sp. 3ASR75-11]|uniref:MBL fold metallo-hydrolase n=1 Tax=Terrihalobacillus insolitus TaxID=2950438 RepID=A0A9X3WWC3_9BACI|nr:MBL fold metallo-hydrolase [Terrihalobacillus insolitus]MDC3413819.1 MBL fold metallo-hydrolase [Terrihalobacillus insolitus]MDC3424534.1 MBL fold metallo-hydrolase [Terrihalobacillus insolitus]